MLQIETLDGVAEAMVASPPDGTGPGVLFVMDAFGLRPRIQEMAQQIAGWGYVVLAPNVFYREGTVAELAPQGDLSTPAGSRELLAAAPVRAFSASRPSRPSGTSTPIWPPWRGCPVSSPAPWGWSGSVWAPGSRSARPDATPRRLRPAPDSMPAVWSSDRPDSPHHALTTARAEFLFGHADNDRSMTPEDVAGLGAALNAAGLTARNEIYAGAPHGYTMADTPSWDEAAFQRAFDNLRDLLDRTLH